MSFRLYKTRIKCLCKNYDTLFWSFGFPILLAIFFYMAFYNLSSGENLDTIPIAVVIDKTDSEFIKAANNARISENRKLFSIDTMTLKQAKEELENNKIAGYIIYRDQPELYVKENGIEQTIIKSFLDRYLQISQTINHIFNLNPQAVNEDFLKDITNSHNFIVDGGAKTKNPDNTIIYFYSLIALTCMFGTNWGFREMIDIQGDQSAIGARINTAPVSKLKLMLCNLLAAFTLHFISILFLLAFLNNILRIEFGGQIKMILLTCFLGSLCGISLGAMVCVGVKANFKVRKALLNAVVLGGGFLSGMVMVQMKYMIAENVPILGYINPSNLITDALYSLYYYDGYERLYLNLSILFGLSVIFCMITYLQVRRREYASI